MAHPRPPSTNLAGGGGGSAPHAVSLKVLRLSRPSLATQTPLPPTHFGQGLDLAPAASRAHPSVAAAAADPSSFPLTPLLTLPAAFGAAYVGEAFACTLCANHEAAAAAGPGAPARRVSGVRIVAELQTPGSGGGVGTALELSGAQGEEEEGDGANGGELAPGETLQRTVRHPLKDAGPHVLAVTVSYTETALGAVGGAASGARVRTFRKLYQFVAQPLVAVRSKVTECVGRGRQVDGRRRWVLEAQVENVGEGTLVVVETVGVQERGGIARVSAAEGQGETKGGMVLKPADVEQVMFMLEETAGKKAGGNDGDRVGLGQLKVEWRRAMGERGSLTTGWLASRGR